MRTEELINEAVAGARTLLAYPRGITKKLRQDKLVGHFAPSTTFHFLPVILLHGLMQNSSSLETIEHDLTRAGFECFPMNYQTLGAGVPAAAEALKDRIDQVLSATGASQVAIVAHSMGGLVTRAALVGKKTARKVSIVITLGSPHAGTPLASRLSRIPLVSSIAKDFMPGSAILTDLAKAKSRYGVTWMAVYSVDDHIVPGKCGRLDCPVYEAHNVELSGIGHAGILRDPRVLTLLRSTLTHDDEQRAA